MMLQAELRNPAHPGVRHAVVYPVSHIFPVIITRGLEALAPLEIGDVVKADCMIAGSIAIDRYGIRQLRRDKYARQRLQFVP